jgi:HEAT repeat protein
MDYSATFARHFSRLVSLLMHEGENVDEQKVSLRALVMVNKGGPVTLVARVVDLLANDSPVPWALTGVRDVAEQMTAHSILEIKIDTGTSAAELLALARIIGADAAPGDGGERVSRKLAALGTKQIEFVLKEPDAGAKGRAASEAPTLPVAAAPEKSAAAPAPSAASRATRDAATLISQLTATDVSKLTPEEVFRQLDATRSPEATTKVLDDVVTFADHAARGGKTAVVGELLYGVLTREAAAEGDTKRVYALAMRRLTKPAFLRAVAMLVPRKPEKKQQYRDVLIRAAEDGADAVIEQVTQAQTTEDRRALFELLKTHPHASAALKRKLGDSRWFVARTAADLLGELASPAAEDALIGLLRHSDDRVRRSATNALLKLGTPNALKGIYEAVSDTSPVVRMQATAAIATKKDGKTAGTLIRAIDDEDDLDVQLAIITALGRVATADAVQKLVKLSEPEGRLFRKKANTVRLAAVQALGEAKTPAALSALRALQEDKDREVREMVMRALAYAAR